MKKLLLVLLVICISISLIACEKKKSNEPGPNGIESPTVQTGEEGEYIEGEVEYAKPDFTDRTDFKVEQSSELSNVSYDRIFLQSKERAQIDLMFSNNRVGSLVVSKIESIITDSSATTSSIGGVEVTYWKAIDQMKHYCWEKDNFYYELSTMDDFSEDELAKIVNGYSAEVGEDVNG